MLGGDEAVPVWDRLVAWLVLGGMRSVSNRTLKVPPLCEPCGDEWECRWRFRCHNFCAKQLLCFDVEGRGGALVMVASVMVLMMVKA